MGPGQISSIFGASLRVRLSTSKEGQEMSTIFGDVVLPPISIIVHWALILGYPLLGESTLGAMGLEDQEVDEIGPAIIISMLMGLGRHQLLLPHSLSKGPTPPAPRSRPPRRPEAEVRAEAESHGLTGPGGRSRR